MKNDIVVSVQCLAFNHEKYIRKTLEGFALQKTTFEFEVIVHDDASTDRTPEIIKEYAEKYPFIHPILQKKNQYSQNILFEEKYIYPLIKGKYIAYCEGDDYWTDENKLQVLYDYMEAHPQCSMCCHAYENIEANSEKKIEEIHTLEGDGTITIERAIAYQNPTQLASQMFRRDCIIGKPTIYLNRGIGDYTVLLNAATLGEIHYIDRVMACHRIAADGSWTTRVFLNKELRMQHDNNMISFLEDFDAYYNQKYHKSVIDKISDYKFDISKIENDFKKQIRYSKFEKLSMKRKIIIVLGCLFPKAIGRIVSKYDYNE